MLAFLFVLAALASAAFTAVVRRYAFARAMIDYPLERSSHSTPTPRGGGLSIVLVVIATIAGTWAFGAISTRVFAALAGGSVLVAAIGWLDDSRNIQASVRAAVQFVAALWTVTFLGGFPRLHVGSFALELDLAGSALAVLGIVWSTNLYNFMDGIDGIAGVQALCVGFFAAVLLVMAGNPGLAGIAIAIAGASAGFLYWNRTPAKIFMGDVGSGFLGYIFAALAIASENVRAVPVLFWAVLAFVFIFDTTLTLILRLRAGYSWKIAHRDHAYQRATRAGFTHVQVSVAVLCINIILGLVAIWMWRTSSSLLEGTLVAGIISAVCYKFVGLLATYPRGSEPMHRERPQDSSRPLPPARRTKVSASL